MKAALYARVSTPEQVEGYSIDAQKRAFKLLCQGRGWEPMREYVDEGKSARTDKIAKRPAFRQALADAQAHAYDVLVVHKLDRFSRNLRITLESLDHLGKASVSFVSISEQMDFSTPWGKLSLTMLGGLAQFYSDNLAVEVKKGKNERKAQGLYNGILPFGVMKGPDGVPKPHDEIWYVVDSKGNVKDKRPPTYEGLKLAFELAARGETDKAIAQVLNARGFRTWGTHGSNPFSKDTVCIILQNRFYVGELPDGKGGWFKDKVKHSPIIPLELFEAAEQARARRRATPQGIRSDAHRYSLSGITRCAACGGRLRVLSPKRMLCNQRIQSNACRQPSAVLATLESQMSAYLQAFKVPADYKEGMLAYCRDSQHDGGTDVEAGAIKARLSNIKDLYSWGDMSKSEYLAERQALQARLARCNVSKGKANYLNRVVKFLDNVATAWEAADQEQRNRLATELFEAVWVDNKVIQGVTPKPEMVPFFDQIYSKAGEKGCSGATRSPVGSAI